jgi:hypothetical protein
MEHFKNFESLFKCQMTIKRYDETGSRGPPLEKTQSYITVNCTSDCRLNKCYRVQVTDISTSTVQRRLRESGLHGRIAKEKPLLKGHQ